MPVDEEVESQHLKFMQNVPAGMSFAEAVSRFNSNVSYSGLLHAVTADVCYTTGLSAMSFLSDYLECLISSYVLVLTVVVLAGELSPWHFKMK